MKSLQSAFSSRRRNHLLLWLSAALLTAGVFVLLTEIAGGSDRTSSAPERGFKPTLPVKTLPLVNAHGVRIRTFEQLEPEVRTTIRTFLATAVARKHLDRSWAVIAPSLRTGYTFSEWAHATALPIIPYPGVDVDRAEFFLEYASTKEILVEVGLSQLPRIAKEWTRPAAFQLGLRPVGEGLQSRWLVSYWMPRWTPPVPADKS
ncbi:MAG TPA: hypothetical protein VFT86_10685 [Gaiellaceae bacterium]|nr:hypothetical protein [Gaiellaceae bacterium]